MKCIYCGGSVVSDPGNSIFPGGLKCLSCGRSPEMEEKKICLKCGKEFPATEEYFSKNSITKGGFENQCKKCRKKYFEDYRKKKKNQSTKKPKKRDRIILPPPRKSQNRVAQSALTTASPEAIVAALRKGVAREIITLIETKFGTI